MAHAAEQLELVLLEPHARPAPEAEAPAGELGCDVLDEDRQPRGQALDDRHQPGTVRFARSQVAQHTITVPALVARSADDSLIARAAAIRPCTSR